MMMMISPTVNTRQCDREEKNATNQPSHGPVPIRKRCVLLGWCEVVGSFLVPVVLPRWPANEFYESSWFGACLPSHDVSYVARHLSPSSSGSHFSFYQSCESIVKILAAILLRSSAIQSTGRFLVHNLLKGSADNLWSKWGDREEEELSIVIPKEGMDFVEKIAVATGCRTAHHRFHLLTLVLRWVLIFSHVSHWGNYGRVANQYLQISSTTTTVLVRMIQDSAVNS
jgi:hypothetical protein